MGGMGHGSHRGHAPGRRVLTNAMVTLVNYGLGNIQAFAHIYRRLNLSVQVASTVEELRGARKLILPGVGAFDWAMSRLNASGLRDSLENLVLQQKVPVLGVCSGMQIMARRSEEGRLPGLGWIDAEVLRLDSVGTGLGPLPHMGWNDVEPTGADPLLARIAEPRYYFLHSYCVVPVRPMDVIATATYGVTFAAAVRSGHVAGTQFHPEKSHHWGVELLRNFAER
jgi:glutamine amidotransferase